MREKREREGQRKIEREGEKKRGRQRERDRERERETMNFLLYLVICAVHTGLHSGTPDKVFIGRRWVMLF